ncbi:MAG: ATP-binding protein [Phycisphaeraceae bacterium]
MTVALSPNLAPTRADDRLTDLAQIISAYNQVTENLQRSHVALKDQVTRLQEQLASADAALQRSKRLAALGEMAAGIAHEVRNPLGAIQLYAGMLTQDLVREPRLQGSAETARKIGSAVRGLDAVVNDVLSFAREVEPRPVTLNAGEVLARALAIHDSALRSGPIRVMVAQGAEEITLYADADLLHQALVNLIRNAVEAMTERPVRGRERTLTLSVRQDDRQVLITVADTGPGMAQHDIDRIFNPFFTTRNTGTGLGLAIVHRIVDAHGGAITARNESPAGGAVFDLSLPAAPEPPTFVAAAVRWASPPVFDGACA